MFFRTSLRARHMRPGGTLRSPFHNSTLRNRFRQRLLSGIAIVAMLSPAAASLAAPCEQKPGGTAYCEPEPELWGGDNYGGKYIYPSYGAKVDAVMGTVISIVGPGAEPVYGPRESLPPPNACGFCSDTAYTHQADETNGYAYAEVEHQSPPSAFRYIRNGTHISAIVRCREGFTEQSDEPGYCFRNGSDRNKDKGQCPHCDPAMTSHPTHAGTGNKYQPEVDYESATGGLAFRRYYNSYDDGKASLGIGWRSNYDRRIIVMTTAVGIPSVMVDRETGSSLVFSFWGGTWHTSKDVNDRLTQLTDVPGGWQYFAAAREETETYDTSGRLIGIQTRAGLITTLSYSGAATPVTTAPRPGLLTRVTDPYGRQLNLTWNGQERIAGFSDPDGKLYAFGYDAIGNLASVTYPGDASVNLTRLYHYESTHCQHALTGITDENAVRFSTYAYDDQCRVASTERAGGVEHIAFTYSPGGTVITDGLNSSRTLTFEVLHGVTRTTSMSGPCARCGGISAALITHDENGNTSSRIDFNGNRTNYTYDLARNLEVVRVEGLSASGDATAATRTITTDWDNTFRLPRRIAEPLRITSFDYDTHGNVVSKTIQPTNDATGALGLNGAPSGAARQWRYAYTYSSTIPGHVSRLTVDGPRTDAADVTTYDWDDSGNLIAVTNALGHVVALGSYDAHGRAQQVVDANGLATTLAYDARGRLIARSVGGESTAYDYDAAGQLTRLTLPDGSFLAYTYDGAHRLTQVQDNLGNRIVYTLDAMGNRVAEQVFDPAVALKQTRARAYDPLNRLVQDIGGSNPLTQITRYSYDTQGNLVSVANPLGHLTTNAYDALNRLQQVIDPAANGPGGGASTRYTYDGLDRLTQVTDPRGLATGYTIDGLGNLTRVASPDTGTASSSFDAAGNLISQLDPRGVNTGFSYDALNRITQATYTPPAGSSIPAVTIAYSYDQGAFGLGRLTSIVDPGCAMSYSYDVHGRLTQDARVIAGVSYVTGYRYDATGRLTQLIYPSGRTATYALDALGRIQQIDTSYQGVTQPIVSGVAYQPFGPVQSFIYGNASAAARNYDLDGRIGSYTLGNLTRTVSYDDGSRITAFSHAAMLDQSFGYDNVNRLTNWSTPSSNQSFGYDAVGNRTSQTVGAITYPYTYAALSNQLTAVAGPTPGSYQYEPAGSLAASSQASFAYDARRRLIQATDGGQGAASQVNALGQRVVKTPTNASPTVYHYDRGGRLIAESDAQGNVLVEYIYLGDIPVAVIQ